MSEKMMQPTSTITPIFKGTYRVYVIDNFDVFFEGTFIFKCHITNATFVVLADLTHFQGIGNVSRYSMCIFRPASKSNVTLQMPHLSFSHSITGHWERVGVR